MSQSETEHEIKREKISEDLIHLRVGNRVYDVHVVRLYRLHDHFGEFTSLEQVEQVIRKMEADQ